MDVALASILKISTMNYKLAILILFSSSLIWSQETVMVEYEFYQNGVRNRSNLIFNKEESSFTVLRDSMNFDKKHKVLEESEDYRRTIILSGREVLRKIYKHQDSDKYLIYSPKFKDKQEIKMYDTPPAIEWNIIKKDVKTILGYDCFRAEGEFRGTNLIAYFTPSIEVNIGPEKFGGLPGLILEIYEKGTTNLNSIKAHKIILHTNASIERQELDNSYVDFQSCTIKFLEDSRKKFKDMHQKAMTSMPRGVRVELKEIERKGFEKVYEWEEKEKGN